MAKPPVQPRRLGETGPTTPVQSWGQQTRGTDPVQSVGQVVAAPGHLIIKALQATAPQTHRSIDPQFAAGGAGAEAAAKAAGARGRSTGDQGFGAPASAAPKKPGTNVTSMQQWLVKQGYGIQVDGVNGPLTQAAAADFRGSRNPTAFNVGHGLVHDTPSTAPSSTAPAANNTGTLAAPATAKTPVAPKLGQVSQGGFYTTPAEARSVLPPDVPGSVVKFKAGKGYYIADGSAAASPGGSAGAAPQLSLQQQAQQIVAAETDPIIKQIQAVEQARATAGQNAITGYTTAEQQLLGNEPALASAAYGGAMQGQNAIDQAIASRLQGQGDQNAAALGSRLTAISADPGTAARLNAQAAQTATGGANAAYASHSATLSALNQEGAANNGYLRGLPGVAGLAGLQASKGLQGQVNTDTNTQLGQITSQLPSMTQSALSALTTSATEQQKNQIASIIASGYDPNTGQLTAAARASLANALGYDPATGKPTARTAAATAKTTAPSAGLSGKLGYLVDSAGNPVTGNDGNLKILPGFTVGPNGTVVKIQKPAAGKGQLTDSQISKMVAGWHDGKVGTVRVPVLDSKQQPVTNNNGVPQYVSKSVSEGTLGYQQAYKQLRAFGVPDQKARAVLDTQYARGENGRAWLTNEEQTALKKAGVQAKAATVTTKNPQGQTVTHHVLTPKQVAALKAAGRPLPPGTPTSDGFLVLQ